MTFNNYSFSTVIEIANFDIVEEIQKELANYPSIETSSDERVGTYVLYISTNFQDDFFTAGRCVGEIISNRCDADRKIHYQRGVIETSETVEAVLTNQAQEILHELGGTSKISVRYDRLTGSLNGLKKIAKALNIDIKLNDWII